MMEEILKRFGKAHNNNKALTNDSTAAALLVLASVLLELNDTVKEYMNKQSNVKSDSDLKVV